MLLHLISAFCITVSARSQEKSPHRKYLLGYSNYNIYSIVFINLNFFILIFPIGELDKPNSFFDNSAKGQHINFIVTFSTLVAGAHTCVDLADPDLHLVSACMGHIECFLRRRAVPSPQSTGQVMIR